MNSSQIRQIFLDFFKSKQHQIVPSAPMVIKNDPTLMFTNAGMNQFKDLFLGNSAIQHSRIADTQKCLRVSGKHNDLEEVGHDTYHHTMFEMLGNWSFGDYFKKEAIAWAWELLTEVYKIDKNRLYVTVFGGDDTEKLPLDKEAHDYWAQIVDKDKILNGSKKDNFWEMGDTGPCGPCSEIHIDLRDDDERQKIDGKELVNTSNPLVIEIWNLVFIEFNRLANGTLQKLSAQHVDTGMGFERLCMVLQNKKSNYDTDVFQPIIKEIEKLSQHIYGKNVEADIAMRVISDHIRAVSFAIADGQLPSNNKAGYVIRRILRRAIRYGYTFLGFNEPFIGRLIPILVNQMGTVFPEIKAQQELICKVITEEEQSFLRTLSNGIHKFENYIQANANNKMISGIFAFELFDTYGFPIDLTQLMAREKGYDVDMTAFHKKMEEQKNRSRADATMNADDWIPVDNSETFEFVGYDILEVEAKISKYRKVKDKSGEYFQVVLSKSPFYAESGGQVGDRGWLIAGKEKIVVENTLKENNLSIHIVKKLPSVVNQMLLAKVDECKRIATANNHSATHLLHAALRAVLGTHVEQKGSLVDDARLRFDFAHFSKMTEDEILKVEQMVNAKIRENIVLEEHRNMPIENAKKMGAMALFGEKYGDRVRVICFDKQYSVELCGGTHVHATGQIGIFKIVSESAIAAGIRRIEAITAANAENFINNQMQKLSQVAAIFKNPKDLVKSVNQLLEENQLLQKKIDALVKEKAESLKDGLIQKIKKIQDINFIAEKVELDSAAVKDLAFALKNSVENIFLVLGVENDGKANITVMLSESLVKEKGLHAGNIVKELAKEINGGGGGQAFFATAGGTNVSGLSMVFEKALQLIKN